MDDGLEAEAVVERNPGGPSDEALVDQARAGSREAFSELVVRYQDRIVHIVAQRLGDKDAAFDVAQDVFIKAYRGLSGFKAESGFYTWLYRIALNTTFSFRRKQKRRGALISLDRPIEDDGSDWSQQVPSEGTAEPGTESERKEEAELLRAAIASLDEDFNEVVVLRDLEGLSYEEIAELLQCPIGSIKSRLHRARKKLLELLKDRIS